MVGDLFRKDLKTVTVNRKLLDMCLPLPFICNISWSIFILTMFICINYKRYKIHGASLPTTYK